MAVTIVEPGNAALVLTAFVHSPTHTISLTLTNDQWEDLIAAAFGHYGLSPRNALIMFTRDLILDFLKNTASGAVDYDDVGDIT